MSWEARFGVSGERRKTRGRTLDRRTDSRRLQTIILLASICVIAKMALQRKRQFYVYGPLAPTSPLGRARGYSRPPTYIQFCARGKSCRSCASRLGLPHDASGLFVTARGIKTAGKQSPRLPNWSSSLRLRRLEMCPSVRVSPSFRSGNSPQTRDAFSMKTRSIFVFRRNDGVSSPK